jgi:hypothetical protein
MNKHTPLPEQLSVDTSDVEKYRHYLDEYDLTEEQKLEFLVTLKQMISHFVDLGFGRDATSLALNKK